MIDISKRYYNNDTIHKVIGTKECFGNISCGFLHKKSIHESNINTCFDKYGGLLVLSGTGVHRDNEGREYNLYPGCFVQRIPGKIHSTYVDGDGKWLEFFICFGADVFENMVNMGIATKEQDVLYPGISYALFDTCEELLNKFKNVIEKDTPLLLFECEKIIYQIFMLHNRNNFEQDREMIEASQILKKYVSSRIGIEEICEELGLGYESFRKTFKKQMGISPSKYIIKERINLAKTILLNEECSIKEVAIRLGYNDSFVFSKQFKDITGISPKQFKKIY